MHRQQHHLYMARRQAPEGQGNHTAAGGHLPDRQAFLDDQEHRLWLAWSGNRHGTGMLRPFIARH